MGTTIATNALLEHNGERCAMVLTEGFEDILTIRDQARPHLFALNIVKAQALPEQVMAAKERIRPVSDKEQAAYASQAEWPSTWVRCGESFVMDVLQPLHTDDIRQKLQAAYDAGIRSQQVKHISQEVGFPAISLSSELMALIKYVPRSITASVDAYLSPLILNYIASFKANFAHNLAGVRLYFIQSDGGLTSADTFYGYRAVLSGPAGGVVGYAHTCAEDLGATVQAAEIAGTPVQAPQVQVHTVAAGGGSLLRWENGMFHVGPTSAGAHPGPACYGKGGPLTVTDANLVLGHLHPDYFPKELAFAFVLVANEAMCRPIRNITEASGHRCAEHALAVFGGAGGQHACAMARSLGMNKIYVHRLASILSAVGASVTDVVEERMASVRLDLRAEGLAPVVVQQFDELIGSAAAQLRRLGFDDNHIVIERFLSMQYEGTNTSLIIAEGDDQAVAASAVFSAEKFERLYLAQYQQQYGFVLSGARRIIIDGVRIRTRGTLQSRSEREAQAASAATATQKQLQQPPYTTRTEKVPPQPVSMTRSYFASGWEEIPVYHVDPANGPLRGPALLIMNGTSVLLEHESTAYTNDKGNVIIHTAQIVEQFTTELSPLPLSIFSHRFMSIAEQMGNALQRTSISTNIKERLDFSCAIFDPDGNLVANAPHIPVHLGAMGAAVRWQRDHYGSEWKEGDVIHLPDITVISAFFHEGKIVSYVASRGHHADLVQQGTFNEDGIREALLAPGKLPGMSGCRTIEDSVSDLRAQVAANNRGIQLLQGLIESYTLEVVQAYMKHIQTTAELAARRVLQRIAREYGEAAESGTADTGLVTLQATDYMDDGTPICLRISIQPESGEATFDFTGSGSQVLNSTNCPTAVVHSSIIYCIRCLVDSDIPLNQGCMKPITVVVPPNSILSPDEDLPVVAGNVTTSQRVTDVVLMALRAVANSHGCMNNFTLGSSDFAYYETICGGSGAGPTFAGTSAVHTNMTNTRLTDPEIFEARYPILLRTFRIRRDSGGAGLHRGGDGVVRSVLALRDMIAVVLTERRVLAPQGLLGGGSGERGLNMLYVPVTPSHTATLGAPVWKNAHDMLHDKMRGPWMEEEQTTLYHPRNIGGKNVVDVKMGDIITLYTAGGGGCYAAAAAPVKPEAATPRVQTSQRIREQMPARTCCPTDSPEKRAAAAPPGEDEPPLVHSGCRETPPSTTDSAHGLQEEGSTATAPTSAESGTALVSRGESRAAVHLRSPATAQQSCGTLIPLNPTTRRIAVGIAKAGISIADGFLLSSSAVLNPVISASFVVYESVKVVQAYRHGELTSLGYRTTKGDVALRIGKELATMGLGMAIGHGVGALIGLSAIPVAGQIAVATVLSVGLGTCIGTLLTHYVDRFMVRLQLRNQYGYPMDERGTRRRFEVLMERRHDLSTLEACRVVQHYADYRVASGWESANDLDDYRASGDITRMPVSLQHFAVVQLQRKWGFVKERAQCRQIYRALLLLHHPDRGGSTELAAQLNKDFEFFAFCQGWDSDCASLLRSAHSSSATAAPADGASRRRRGSVIVDYLRSLFRPTTNSRVGANDLHQFGLLALEAGTPAEMHRRDVTAALSSLPAAGAAGDRSDEAAPEKCGSLGDIDSFSDGDGDEYEDTVAVAAVRQRSVTRVLRALHEVYTATAEAITFSGLIQVSDDTDRWSQLHQDVSLFQRLQYFISLHAQALAAAHHESAGQAAASDDCEEVQPLCAAKKYIFRTFRWSTVPEAVAKREEARSAIVAAVFTPETSQQLTSLLELWRTAKAMAESYFRACQKREADGRPATSRNEDEGRQTLDALLRIHTQIEAAGTAAREPWEGRMEEWATRTVPGFSSFMEDVKEVGLTASNALAAEYAAHAFASVRQQCSEYFKGWSRKQDTLQTLLAELQLEYTALRGAAQGSGGGSPSSTAPGFACDPEAARRIDDYQTQLLLLHKQMAEVDVGVAEWANTCAAHFPELTTTMLQLPSTCVESVVGMRKDSSSDASSPNEATLAGHDWTHRFLAFERERTLLHYTRVEAEPVNPLDPFTSRIPAHNPSDAAEWEQAVSREESDAIGALLRSFEANEAIEDAVVGRHGVGMTLLQALYNDPLTGESTPCWLKRYSFAGAQSKKGVTGLRALAQSILAEEVAVSAACSSDRVVSARDIFYNRERHEIFVHYVRGATQQRFRSVNDVRRQVEPLGLRWLHDVLECVACLHACQLAHGHICLSAFTYDDFGNTALGVFHPAWEGHNSVSPAPAEEPSVATTPAPSLADRQHYDVIDVGIMLLTELLPLFNTARSGSSTPPPAAAFSALTLSPTSRQPPPGRGGGITEADAVSDDMVRVMEAVAAHLVGKEEPRWSLLDARQFVRRFQQLRSGDLAIFSKQVAYPASWAIRCAVPPVQLVAVDATPFRFPATLTASAAAVRVYHNRHVSLWETYWRCRHQMTTLHRGSHMLPSEVAWERCQDGFRSLRRDATQLTLRNDMLPLSLVAPSARPDGSTELWGVICRATLGTTLEETEEEFAATESKTDMATAQYNKLSYAAQRRSHLVTRPQMKQEPQSESPEACAFSRQQSANPAQRTGHNAGSVSHMAKQVGAGALARAGATTAPAGPQAATPPPPHAATASHPSSQQPGAPGQAPARE
ncbi:Hydantoinase B/oxoprolinase family protein [Leishmania donovani]|uniref:Hydantoinase B/oxoprolinase family protein n=1 Tax=Leishmania donovani TaxID=5661 RepID=A0A504XZ82_LEIDO|nr:Hydantoinase B/oxoprolinase family protein [Leishmania donovani]